MFEKRKKEIEKRKLEIRSSIEKCSVDDLTKIEKELDDLNLELTSLEKRAAILASTEALNTGDAKASSVDVLNPNKQQNRTLTLDEVLESKDYRYAFIKTMQGKLLSETEKRAWSTVEESGGAVVPETIADEIITKLRDIAPFIDRIKIYNIPGALRVPVQNERTPAEVHVENGAITISRDNLREIKIDGYGLYKLVQASREVLAASVRQFEQFIIDSIVEEVAWLIEFLLFNGTGEEQPGGVLQGGNGTNGAYTEGTDQLTIPSSAALTEKDVLAWIAMVSSRTFRNSTIAMTHSTFLRDFYPLKDKAKNVTVEFVNGTGYVMGREVVTTDALDEGVCYIGDFNRVIGNFTETLSVDKSEEAGFTTASTMYRGGCIFGMTAVSKVGAFAKLIKESA